MSHAIRLVVAGLALAFAGAACGGGDAPGDGGATATASLPDGGGSLPTAPAAIATKASASPTAAAPACPFDDKGICTAAARVEELLVTLSFDQFATYAVERTVACPATTVATPGLPPSLCTGKAAGEQVTGYSAGVRRGGTAVYSRDDFQKFLLQTRVEEQPQRSDGYGSGLLRVVSIADASDAGCRDCHRVELSRLQLSAGQPVRRAVSVWLSKQPGGEWRPVVIVVGSYLNQKEMDAQVRGGGFDGVTYVAWATGTH